MTVANALTDLTSVMTAALGIISDNAILTTIFVSGLLATGFKLVKKAKNAVK